MVTNNIYSHLSTDQKSATDVFIPLQLQTELALLWRTIGLIRYTTETTGNFDLFIAFFEEFLEVVKEIPKLSLSVAWNSSNGDIVGIPKVQENANTIPILPIPELSYLHEVGSIDGSDDHDPLRIVQKLFETAENLALVLPSHERFVLLQVCVALGMKSARISLLLRSISLLLADDGLDSDIGSSCCEDIRSYCLAISNDWTEEEKSKGCKDTSDDVCPWKQAQAVNDHGTTRKRIGGMLLTHGKAEHGKLGHGDAQVISSLRSYERHSPRLIELMIMHRVDSPRFAQHCGESSRRGNS